MKSVEAAKEGSDQNREMGVSPLPCELLPENYFGFREAGVEIGDVLQGELAGDEVQDGA